MPAQLLHAAHVEQLLRGSIGLCGIEDQLAGEAQGGAHQLCQLSYGHIDAGSDVDQRYAVEQGGIDGSLELHEKNTGLCQVFTEEEFAARSSRSPDRNLLSPQSLGLRYLADQGGQHMRFLGVEIVARAVEIGGHRGQIAGFVLPVVGPTHFNPGDLGQRVGTISGLQRSGEQILFLDWLRTKLWVNAG